MSFETIMNTEKCFYISGMSEDDTGGIFRCVWKDEKPVVEDFYPLERNTFLERSADGKVIYASMQHDGAGGVAAYRVGEKGKLALLNTLPANGRSVCFLQASANGRFLYTANYASGNISEFVLNEDGSLAALKQSIAHTGSGIRSEQDAPHPHCCVFTPDKRYLCVADLGIDKVLFYPYDPEQGIAPEAAKEYAVTPGYGPRHLFFDAAGKFACLLCELCNMICQYRYEDGELIFIGSISTLPEGENSGSASTVKFSRDGKFLYAGNRGGDTIAVFAVDEKGILTAQRFYDSGGRSPRDFNFLPSGDILVVGNEFSGAAGFFRCDREKGEIFERCASLELPRPLYVLV